MAPAHEARSTLAASVLDALPDAVMACDAALVIVYANERCELLFGYERGELADRSATELLPGALPQGEQAGGPTNLRGQTKEGMELLLEAAVSTLDHPGGRLTLVDLREAGAAPREHELGRDEASFRTVLEGLPDAVVASRPDGLIAFVNARAEELFGYSSDELVGGPVDRLWPRPLRERYSRNMQRLFDDGQSLRFTREARGLRRDGSEFPGEMTWGVVEIASGPLMLAVGRDISARLEADQRVRRYSAERAVAASLGERALAGVDPAELAGQVAEAVAKTMEVGMVQVLSSCPVEARAFARCPPGATARMRPGRWPAAGAAHAQAALSSAGPLAFGLGDLGGGATDSDLASAGVRSGMAVAVRTGEEGVFGVIAAYAWSDDAFDGEGGAFLQAVANVLATAVGRRVAWTCACAIRPFTTR